MVQSPPTSPRRFLLIEIWEENREIFKTLITHPLLYSIPLGSLFLIDLIIRKSALDEAEKSILLRVDFYGIALVLVIFTGSFIMEVLVLVAWKVRHGKRH